jgi:thiol-disulfide isomerase/thioredoxin
MKKILFLISLTLILNFIVSAQNAEVSVQSKQIVWEKDYKKALALAKETNRPLLLDFSADWCKPCKMMEEQFWVLPEVVDAVKPFIAVKIDFDAERSLVAKYGVTAIPYVAFTDPLGNLITARRGFSSKKVAELNMIFDEMPKDFSPLKKYYDAIELKKDDGDALLAIADSYRASKMLRLSNEFYLKTLKTNEIETDTVKKERVMLTLGINAYTLQNYELATDYLEDYLKTFPSEKNREKALAMLSVGYAARGKSKNSGKYLELLKTEFPESKYIAAALKAIDDAKNSKDK